MVNLLERRLDLLARHIDELREAVRATKRDRPFHIDAWVVLPDHMHALWTLPTGDCDYPTRWMLIKAGFSRQLPKCEIRSNSRVAKGERGIWQRRYWEHLIRDNRDFERHVDYIHYNPFKHGYAQRVADWPWSSFHRYVRQGMLSVDWAGQSRMNENDEHAFGECNEYLYHDLGRLGR